MAAVSCRLCLCTPHTLSSSRNSCSLSSQQLAFHRNPISSSSSSSSLLCRSRYSFFSGNGCCSGYQFVLNSSASSLQDYRIQTNAASGGLRESDIATEESIGFSVETLLLAYKTAYLNGDDKTLHELEETFVMLVTQKHELVQKISALSTEISAEKEKCIRLKADFDNYRKREEKKRSGVRDEAQAQAVESLLPLVDSFDRARLQIKAETEQEKKIDASYKGIYRQFVEIMRSLKVTVIPTVGKPFDPSMHDAISREESVQFKEGIVSDEHRRGFFLGGRLLRPAMVKVSSGPGKTNTASVS